MGNFWNRFNSALDYSVGTSRRDLFPKMVGIEVTNLCNLECVMCPHSEMTRSKGVMNFELFCRLIDEIKGRTELVYLYGVGESLLIKTFFDYLAYAKAAGLTTCLSTNATVLTPKIADKLMASGLDYIILAVDGASPETYNQIRVGGEFEKTLAKCKLVVQEKIRQRAKTDICVQIISMEATEAEENRQKACFTEEEQKAINQFRIKPHFDQFAQIPQNLNHRTPCFFLWDLMSITWDGRVCLCCFDFDAKNSLGDVSEMSILDVWNGHIARQKRELHRKRQFDDLPMCATCTLPELGYFSPVTVWGSTLMNAYWQRKLVPYLEKLHVLNRTARLNKRLNDGGAESKLPWWRQKKAFD